MTEKQLRQKMVSIAGKYVGCNEKDGSFKKIIDLYNSHTPRARGYKLQYTDAWCDGFASAVAIEAELTDIIPTEVGCGKHIALFQKLGCWVENDGYTPEPGDYIFYDWQDTGAGDNKGAADHVGIVEKVSGGTITVIEGNMSEKVGRRKLKVNGKYIRGYGVPNYASKAAETEPVKTEPAKPAAVKIDGAMNGPSATYSKTWTVNATLGLHLRTGANTKKSSLGIMVNKTRVRCYGYYTKQKDGTIWLLVVVQNGKLKGKTGFCSLKYLK